jgi:hypothetical protein
MIERVTRRALKMAAVAALGAALLSAACADPTPPAAPSPVSPSFTDTFTGTLAVAGTNGHQFAVQQVGGVQVSLTGLDPGAAVGVGVGVPSPVSGTCSVLSSKIVVVDSGPQLIGTATVAGNFCVSIRDVGNLVAPIAYTLVVYHS